CPPQLHRLQASQSTQRLVAFNQFLFQAEDGRRDFHVTGVQTCALPISGPEGTDLPSKEGTAPMATKVPDRGTKTTTIIRPGGKRSEERRVGKECRTRESPIS